MSRSSALAPRPAPPIAAVAPVLLALLAFAALAPEPAGAIGRSRRRPPPPPPAPTAPDDAEVSAHDVPASMRAGERVAVTVTVRNRGSSTWTADAFRLGAVGDGAGDAARFGPGRVELPAGSTVAPGQAHVFRFEITAPAAGAYEPKWRMVHELVRWFGDEVAPRVTVASAPVPPPSPIDLTAARRRALERIDRFYRGRPEDPTVATPNLTIRPGLHHEWAHLDKAAAIFGLVDMGAAPRGRLAEANAHLRYAMFAPAFRPTGPAQLVGANRWAHRSRTLGMRLYALFAGDMDADITAEYERRFAWMIEGPYRRKSENIKLTQNSARLLAHELLGRTGEPTYDEVRRWLVGYLKGHGTSGTYEWGGGYNAWTFLAILNLAEFSRDPELSELALMVIDSYLARQLTVSIGAYQCSPAVREYGHSLQGSIQQATQHAMMLFTPEGVQDWAWADHAVSNYRPLRAHHALFAVDRPYEARLSNPSANGWRAHFHRGERFAIATHQAVAPDHFVQPSGGTHDVIGCRIQSAKAARNYVVPYGHTPGGAPKKKRNVDERYFGYQNIALINHGGTTRAVWAGGTFRDVPVRLYYDRAFTRRVLRGGWAFLTDGEAFVAWAPTRGDPIEDPRSSQFSDPRDSGGWLRSTHVPGDEGETCVVEAGDAASHGSFAAFQDEILARNPRPRVGAGDVVRYVARDGAVLELGRSFARVDGRPFDPSGWPLTEGPGVRDLEITATGGAPLRFDFDRVRTTGPRERLPVSHVFGR